MRNSLGQDGSANDINGQIESLVWVFRSGYCVWQWELLMQVEKITPILNVSNLLDSISWFEKLGWKKCWVWGEPPTFGAVGSGKCQIFLCQDGQGSRGGPMPRYVGDDDTGGVWMSWWVPTPESVDEACDLALKNGLMVTFPPTNEPWGVRECHIRHPDGHTFRISAGIEQK